MPPRARILGLASACILAGSGCDYWRNLIEPKKEDKVDLVLSLKDAWTGEALAEARCSVDSAEAVAADAEGRISLPAMPTGSKALACSSASYHGLALTLEARPDRPRIDIPMARMGGEHWYPDHDDRQVRIRLDSGNLLFPGNILVRGFPGDTAGRIFQYTWTSTHHAGLRPLAKVPVHTLSQPADSLEFTLTLAVSATLTGRTYEVGTDSRTYKLKKNRPPTLSIQAFKPPATVQVGTGCVWEPVDMWLDADDPDGECRVRISSKKADSPIGLIDTTADCGKLLNFQFPIKSHNGPPGKALYHDGILEVEVSDGNDGKADTMLQVVTRSNMHPVVEFKQLDAKAVNLTGQEQKFWISARDLDTMLLREVYVDWKNGDKDSPRTLSHLQGSYSFVDTLTHIFTDAGSYVIEAKVRDACRMQTIAELEIDLVDNRIPKVSVEGIRFNPASGEYDIRVKASDEDVSSGIDSLIATVAWGHMLGIWMHQDFKPIYGTYIDTSFGIPFRQVENSTGYEIYVTAQDKFGGLAYDTLRLTPKQAFGLP